MGSRRVCSTVLCGSTTRGRESHRGGRREDVLAFLVLNLIVPANPLRAPQVAPVVHKIEEQLAENIKRKAEKAERKRLKKLGILSPKDRTKSVNKSGKFRKVIILLY